MGFRSITHGPSTPWNAYTAVLTQAGVAAPTVNVLANEIGVIAWAYSGVGVYTATLAGAFDVDGFTFVSVMLSTGAAAFCAVAVTSANVLTFSFFDAAGVAVDLGGIAFVEIRVY